LSEYDAVVVGAGPNGLAAAVEIARHGHSVLVLEAADTIGGGARSAELTLPGFIHDTCSAIHPMGLFSPFFRDLPLQEHGLKWIHATYPLVHPLDDGSAAFVHISVDETAKSLGADADAYRRLMEPLVRNAEKLGRNFLGPALFRPSAPIAMGRFGLHAVPPASWLTRRFEGPLARAMFAGNAAHAIMPLNKPITGGFALIYNIFAHAVGWPMAKGGSQKISDALASYLGSLGGKIECGRRVERFEDLPSSEVTLFDIDPHQVAQIARGQLPDRFRRSLQRFDFGPGVFKVDWALDAPIPWKSPEWGGASTLHLGGTFEEIAASELEIHTGQHSQRPWVIISQQTTFDPSRAPAGKHTAWAYMHVPHGSTLDMTDVLESQVERFAPGFKERVLARAIRTAGDIQAANPTLVGGDIGSGSVSFRQLLARPTLRWSPQTTPNEKIYLCSQSTAPGPGVHGMCGYFGARAALKRLR
jgi:phytoene dehydrogenase-like protein